MLQPVDNSAIVSAAAFQRAIPLKQSPSAFYIISPIQMAVIVKLMCKSARLFGFKSGRKTLHPSFSSSSSSWGYESDSDYYEEYECSVLRDVPKGCMAIYVGDEKRRFIVSTHLLKNHVFQVLLERAAEEYGYENEGALTIPCEAVLFEHLLWLINSTLCSTHVNMSHLDSN